MARLSNPVANDYKALKKMNITIFGMGYVGLTSACCLAADGHQVSGVDTNQSKVAAIHSGLCPIVEPNIPDMLSSGVDAGRICVSSASASIKTADVAIVCVGTPSAPDGSHNMSHIVQVCHDIMAELDNPPDRPLTIVFRSTFKPGTMDRLIKQLFVSKFGSAVDRFVELVYNPEFMREGTAVADYFAPARIVIGTAESKECSNLASMYQNIDAPIYHVDYRTAEFAKFVDNTWHALKVAFANEIGSLCLDVGVSPSAMSDVFLADRKLNISDKYLRPGGAFGGSCLPKDVRALHHLADEHSVKCPIIQSIIPSNEDHKNRIYKIVTHNLTKNSVILLAGLAFKSETDDLRESPNVNLAAKLIDNGFVVRIFDPNVKPEQLLGVNLGYAYTNIPRIMELIVSEVQLASESFDRVVLLTDVGKTLPPLVRAQAIDITKLKS